MEQQDHTNRLMEIHKHFMDQIHENNKRYWESYFKQKELNMQTAIEHSKMELKWKFSQAAIGTMPTKSFIGFLKRLLSY